MPQGHSIGPVQSSPLLFEALPPQVESSEAQWHSHLDRLDGLKALGLTAVNIPEIVTGDFQTVEPRAFAAALGRRLGVRTILNRVTVHHTAAALHGWLAETQVATGIRDFIFVGGERSAVRYPGVPVPTALRQAAPSISKWGGSLGVITIAHRRRPDLDEPQRLLAKQEAGASFAVSQILATSVDACRLQVDLAAAAAGRQPPLSLFWSLAPVARPRDLEFLAWLGVQVPAATKRDLLAAATPDGRLTASHALNEQIARELLDAAEANGLPAPGFCIEHVMLNNVGAGIELVERIRAITKEYRGLRRAQSSLIQAW